jgi:hypothetical protein
MQVVEKAELEPAALGKAPLLDEEADTSIIRGEHLACLPAWVALLIVAHVGHRDA